MAASPFWGATTLGKWRCVPSKLKKMKRKNRVGTPIAMRGNINADDSDVTVRTMHYQFWEDLCFSGRKLLWQCSPQR